MSYLVMECHLSYAVVLDDEGRFLTVANRRYQVGQRVSEVFALHSTEENNVTAFPAAKSAKRTLNRWVVSLAAVAACLMLAVGSSLYLEQLTYASVYMAINPEVRIDVNRSDRVVGLEGGNQDGIDLIEGYEYRRKELDIVMDELVDLAIRDGYLHEGGKVTLTLDSEDDQWEVTHSDRLDRHLRETLTEKLSVAIEVRPQSAVIPEPAPSESQPPQSQPPQAEESIQVVIPVGPESSKADMDAPPPPEAPSTPVYQEQTGNAYGDSSYDTADGNSPYEPPSDDNGDSNYESSKDDNGDSPYDPPDNGDGDSNYDDRDYNDDRDDDGNSGYGQSDDDDDDDDD